MKNIIIDNLNLNDVPDKNHRMFTEREESNARISFEREQVLFNCIKSGDVDGISQFLRAFDGEKLEAGKMSPDSLRQSQYVAVTLVAIGIRYAIMGGMLETESYSLSDYFIQQIDRQRSPEGVMALMREIMITLTDAVRRAKDNRHYSPYVRKAIDYIYKNLHSKITLAELSEHCGITQEYLSRLFKKEVGYSICIYITKEKLAVARSMLRLKEQSCSEIAHTLGFCSQSHFIRAFKAEYGVTPGQFRQ